MRRLRKWAIAAAIAVIVLAAAAGAIVVTPTLRASAAAAVLRLVLAQRGGFTFHAAGLTIDRSRIAAQRVEIDDVSGKSVFSAALINAAIDPRFWWGKSDRRYGLVAVSIAGPQLHVVRLADGSFNLSPLLHGGSLQGGAARVPFRFTLDVRDGSATFRDPSAYAPPGRSFSLERVALHGGVDQGGVTQLRLSGEYKGTSSPVALRASLLEDDRSRFALAQLQCPAVDVAPIVDGIVPAPAFAVDSGTLRHATLHAFAIDYDPSLGPSWQLSGTGELTDGAVRVRPLVEPIVGLHGPVAFAGGHLGTIGLTGTLEGAPVIVRGGIRLQGGVLLGLSVRGRQSLARFKNAFSFARALEIDGPIDLALRVDGAPSNVDVAARYLAPDVVDYTGAPLTDLAGTLFYNGGHLTLPVAAARYEGATVWAVGDIDFTPNLPMAAIDVAALMPAARLPFVANVNDGGTARGLVEFDGPIAALRGLGYAEIVGGNGTTVRTAFYAGPDRFAVGPAIVDAPSGGTIIAQGGIDRSTTPRTIAADVVARGMPITLAARAVSLPGFAGGSTFALPDVSGIANGTVLVRGSEGAPSAFVDASADDVVVSNARLGRIAIVAAGNSGRVDIRSITISGADADIRARGSAELLPGKRTYAAAVSGTARADLRLLSSFSRISNARGTADGSFAAELAGGRWAASLDANSSDASIANVRVASVDASVGGGGGSDDLYAGTLRTGGGSVSGIGAVPGSSAGDLQVWTDGLDVRSLGPANSPLSGGRAVGVARFQGSIAAPIIAGAATIDGASIGGQPAEGDLDVRYAGDTLVANDARVSVGGGFARLSGSIAGIGSSAPLGDARLALRAAVREGDLGALAGRYLPKGTTLTGTVGALLSIGGTVGAPDIDGRVNADSGTLGGVAFDGLRGNVHIASGSLDVSGGSVGIESSRFAFSGSLSPDALHLHAASPHVDLSDFNDFFAGYDTLEGVGSGSIAFQSTRTGVDASGRIDLANAAVAGFPLGSIVADFASRKDQVLAHVRQNGPAGRANLAGTVAFAPRRSALPNLKTARYDVRGSLRDVDIAQMTPLLGRSESGITGLLDVDGSVRGSLHAPIGSAHFDLRNGHIQKVAISDASGFIDTDGRTFWLRDAAATLPFAHITGGGSFGAGKRINANVTVDATDLRTLAALLGQPNAATGDAQALVTASGTLSAPSVTATILGGSGTMLGVGFDRLSGRVRYAPGSVEIADVQVALEGGRGTIGLTGTLPLQLSPFGLGPKDRPIDLSLTANSVRIGSFDPLTSRYVTMVGLLDATGTVTGTAGRPQVSGAAHLRSGGIQSRFETVPAENIDADLGFSHDTLTLTRFGGTLGRGTFGASGAMHIVPAAGLLTVASLQYWTRVDLHQAQIDVPGWTSGSLDGDLRITKSGAVPFFSGDVTLNDGTIPFSAIYALASGFGSGPAPTNGQIPGVPELTPGHIIVYGGSVFGSGGPYTLSAAPGTAPTPAPRALPSVDLSVAARAGKNVRVHGGDIDLSATGAVAIGGNLRSPTLSGTFTSTRGVVGYFDTNFRLERGAVTFDPVEGLLPTLDVKAVTNTGGVEITLTITGRVDNLQTELSSNPSMSRDEIVATLLHAPQVQSVISSSPAQAQSQIYAEAQSYFNAQLTRSLLFPVESALAQTINVEQISLIYDQSGNVDVEVRKQITPTVYGIYRSTFVVPVTQTVGVAYTLRDYADVEILQTQSPSGLQQTVLNLRLTFH